jgi:hypothetical protein
MKKICATILVIGVLLAAQGVFAPARGARALGTTWTVQSTADGPGNAGHCPGVTCTLRDAVFKAVDGDTINFAVTGTITLTEGDLVLYYDVTIAGPGAALMTIDANHLSRIFGIVGNVNVSISGLKLTHGLINDANETAGDRGGGAILNYGHLTLGQVVIDNNRASCSVACENNGVDGAGGGVDSTFTSSLTITDSSITNSTATLAGGGVAFGSTGATGLVLSGVKVSANEVTDVGSGNGGGLYISGTPVATLDRVVILSNTAGYRGAGLFDRSTPLTVTNSTINMNHASNEGGGI